MAITAKEVTMCSNQVPCQSEGWRHNEHELEPIDKKNLLMLCDFGSSLIDIWQLAISGNLLIPVTLPKWVWCAAGTAFQQPYPHLSNPLPIYHGLP
jgi:hypothetical protein